MFTGVPFRNALKVFSILLVAIMVLSPMTIMAQDESTNACMQAEQDAAMNTNGTLWFAAGCLGGIVGLLVAYAIQPNPPASKLVGKSPTYVATYTDCYRSKAKNIQTHKALLGCGVAAGFYLVYWVVIAAAASST
ncbi:hypothetical protein BMS3Abin05_02242 [bacterium BMS3Abin05]|nr:hypothetical protein BMS3Abin05_02242 [bacterium BMS3Abin05]GBE28281.1 hypothetical protein BMS3Bbin03_02220 [bacterium BMS3Bbin03]